MNKTPPPKIDDAPGHRWQARAGDRWVCLWVARSALVKAGYTPKTQRIWPPTEEPNATLDEAARLLIRSECNRLQNDMRAWQHNRNETSKPTFDGTFDSLIKCYQADPDSDFQEIRWKSRQKYASHLRQVSKTVGKCFVSETKGRDLKRWFKNWSSNGLHIPRAAARMTMVRIILKFGSSILDDEDCAKLRGALADMTFEQGKRRTVVLTREHVNAIRSQARAKGAQSMALAEAMKFSLIVRPKDVIGEWIPISEPGTSAIIRGKYKWLFGFDWREVDASFTLVHRISKSIRGREGITRPDAGKTLTYQLLLYPMVIEELCLIASVSTAELRRDLFPASGPMIVYEATGTPYHDETYRENWRKVATAAGVPKSVQGRDARAGGGTEAKRLGGRPEDIQKAMGHSKIETTWIYLRDDDETVADIAELRGKQQANKKSNTE